MIDRIFFNHLRAEYRRYSDLRRLVIKEAGDALSFSKQAIFAFHRDDFKNGLAFLSRAVTVQKKLQPYLRRTPGLVWEGVYRAMLEEFVEASLYCDYLRSKKIGVVRCYGLDEDAYLGGLLDLTGELVRRAVNQAAQKNFPEVRRVQATVERIMTTVIKMDITGPLRPKYDQARSNLRKLEEINYDLSLRR